MPGGELVAEVCRNDTCNTLKVRLMLPNWVSLPCRKI